MNLLLCVSTTLSFHKNKLSIQVLFLFDNIDPKIIPPYCNLAVVPSRMCLWPFPVTEMMLEVECNLSEISKTTSDEDNLLYLAIFCLN